MNTKSFSKTLKIVATLAFAAIVLVVPGFFGCYSSAPSEVQTHTLDSIGQDTVINTKVLTFEYAKHNYLEFLREEHSYVIHDPECKCMQRQLVSSAEGTTKSTVKRVDDLDQNNRSNFRVIIDKCSALEGRLAQLEAKIVNMKPVIIKQAPPAKPTPKPAPKPAPKQTPTLKPTPKKK